MRINNFQRYNESFREEIEEKHMLLDLRNSLVELVDQYKAELDEIDGRDLNHTLLQVRYPRFQLLCEINELVSELGHISALLYFYKGKQ